MSIDTCPLRAEHLDDAASLLAGAYDRQRASTPLLPERGLDCFREHLERTWRDVGVAAFAGSRLCGFMMESMRFGWKGQQAAGCNEMSHTICPDDPAVVCLLYRDLGARWVDEGRHLHIVGHSATDEALIDGLFHLGFGAFLCEQLRDPSPLERDGEFAVLADPDPELLVELQNEHRSYYRSSPIFLRKDNGQSERSDLEAHLARGDRLLAGVDEDDVTALFIVGESASEGEGLLLRSSNTAQLKSAFVRPHQRRRGIGTALLARSISWAQEQGYERVFVEHETANIAGAAFWGRHFDPYLLYSMRYVDNTL